MDRKMDKYTAEQVSSHNDAGDLWIALHGKVYDMSNFLKEHPGGEEVLLELAGKDGTKCFDDIGHSQEAILLKDGYQIGVLEGEFTTTTTTRQPTVDDDDWEYEEPKKQSSPVFSVLIALGAVVYAVLFYYMFL